MNKNFRIIRTITQAVFTLCILVTAIPQVAFAADYTIEVPSAQNGSFGTSTVDVTGQNLPSISMSAIPDETTIVYPNYKLFINESEKTHWTNSRETVNYQWKLCEANTNIKPTNGVYTVNVIGIDAFSRNNTLATTTFNLAGLTDTSCTSTSTTSPTLSITGAVKIPNNAKILTFTLASSGLTTAQLCASYTVLLIVSTNGTDSEKGTFCKPNAATLQTVDWDSSGSTPGQTYTVFAKALGQNNSGNAVSPSLTYTMASDGTPSGGTNGDNGGNGGSGNGTLKPIQFGVPDLSRLEGKSGLALRMALLDIIIDFLIVIVSMFALIAFLYSGVMYGLSFGDPAKAEKAKKNLLWAVMGVVIVMLSVVLLNIISQLSRTLV